MSEAKYICDDCDGEVLDGQILKAPNPFNPSEALCGCPHCKSVGELWLACDEPGCWRKVTCGTTSDAGYRRVCGDHFRVIDEAKAPAPFPQHGEKP